MRNLTRKSILHKLCKWQLAIKIKIKSRGENPETEIEKWRDLMNWRVHRIGTNWTFKKFVNTGGRMNNDALDSRRRKLRMEIQMGMMGRDLILIDSIRRCNAFNAIFFHLYSWIPKSTSLFFLDFYTRKIIAKTIYIYPSSRCSPAQMGLQISGLVLFEKNFKKK